MDPRLSMWGFTCPRHFPRPPFLPRESSSFHQSHYVAMKYSPTLFPVVSPLSPPSQDTKAPPLSSPFSEMLTDSAHPLSGSFSQVGLSPPRQDSDHVCISEKACNHNHRKCVKLKRSTTSLVLGEDVSMNDVVSLAKTALVGRFTGCNMGITTLCRWSSVNMEPTLGYNPKVFTMAKGWLGFVLCSEEDVDNLLSGIWLWGTARLKLKRWSPFLDPRREKKFNIVYG
jgi:hypothetical protein